MARKSIFARIRDFFSGNRESEVNPLPIEDSGYIKLKDVDMPNQIKRLYDDLFNHIWGKVGHPSYNYDHYMELSIADPEFSAIMDFDRYLDECFENDIDTEFRIKINRLNHLLGDEYAIKDANTFKTFITEKRYPKSS